MASIAVERTRPLVVSHLLDFDPGHVLQAGRGSLELAQNHAQHVAALGVPHHRGRFQTAQGAEKKQTGAKNVVKDKLVLGGKKKKTRKFNRVFT